LKISQIQEEKEEKKNLIHISIQCTFGWECIWSLFILLQEKYNNHVDM